MVADVHDGNRADAKAFAAWRKQGASSRKKHEKLIASVHLAAKKLRESHRKKFDATSFVVEIDDVSNSGIEFTGRASQHQSDEVGFDRTYGVEAHFIEHVYVVLDGKILRKMTAVEFFTVFEKKLR